MIGEAVSDFKGEKHDSPAELKLELPIDAHIPATYLDSERLRLEAYHKLSASSGETGTIRQLEAILSELEDRYGKAPEPVKNLLEVTELRQFANRLGLKDVNFLGNLAKLQPVDLTESQQVKLSHKFQGLRFLQSATMLQIPIPKDEDYKPIAGRDLIAFTRAIFEELEKLKIEESK
jgi:transcription-repair coupling factor (superfamily II helicase)